MKFIRKVGKGLKTFMEEKVEACKELLSSAQNRAVLGVLIIFSGIGIGGGLLASAFIRVPA